MNRRHLHLISDSTGGTLTSVVKACLSQFDGVEVEQHFWPLVRSRAQLDAVLAGLRESPGLALYTLVDDALAVRLERECQDLGCPALSILHPVLKLLSGWLGQASRAEPGLQHRLNAEYFARMDAVDYALHHDDGQQADRGLHLADVILVGVSRTSKTPTCLYLANRGIRAANIPLVPGVPLPAGAEALSKPLFVGLTAAPERLIDIRRNRLAQMGAPPESDYLDPEQVRDEVRAARRFFTEKSWPVIDVTRRSVEETAAEIIALLDRHRAAKIS